MKVTTERATATVRRVARIEDGPVVSPAGYRRDYRVETVAIDYDWKDGRFELTSKFSINMSGHWVKKDGGDAKDLAGGMRPEYESYDSNDFAAQYGFLRPLVEQLRPGSDLSMTILNEAEVPS